MEEKVDTSFWFSDSGKESASILFARRAVLWPIVHSLGEAMADVRLAATAVLDLWRKRIGELAGIGYEPFLDNSQLPIYRNCCPSMVYASPRNAWQCKSSMCPWNRGRQAVRLGELLNLNKPSVIEKQLVCQTLFYCKHDCDTPEGAASLGDLKNLLRTLSGLCGVVAKSVRAYGGKVLYRSVDIAPCELESGSRAWKSSSRIIAVRPAAAIDPPLPLAGWIVEDLKEKNAGSISKVVSRLTEYPTGLLLGDVQMTKMALLAREGQRLLYFWGSSPHDGTGAADSS